MATVDQKKVDNKDVTGSIVTGVAKVAAIAGVAVAATMALENKKTRKKVKDALTNAKDRAMNYIETLAEDSSAQKETNIVKKASTKAKKVLKKNK